MTHDKCPRFPSFAECGLRYNLSESERLDDERLHQTELNIPPIADSIDDSEYRRIANAIAPDMEKHNEQCGFTVQGKDFYYLIGEQFRGDRTIEVIGYGNADYTAELVIDLQELLRDEFPLWRILLESCAIDDLILIYPDCVRNYDASPGEPLTETLARVNAHSRDHNRLMCRYLIIELPGYRQPARPPRLNEAKVAYNAEAAECEPGWPRFNTVTDPPELTMDEYLEIEKDLVPALERYGYVVTKNDLSDTSKEKLNSLWLLRTAWMQWDRTRVLVKYGNQEFSDAMIRDIQSALQRWPLWRVALDANDERDVRFVYPDVVR